MSNPKDTRIVYGAKCLWWDSIDKVGKLPFNDPDAPGIPCCPVCKGPLFEASDEEQWFKDAAEFGKQNNDIHYVNYLKFMRGKCRKDVMASRVEFDNTLVLPEPSKS